MSAPELSICIINHKTPELTRQCLQSIADTAGELAIEVMVVNNTADACDVADVRRPGGVPLDVVFIQNAAPLGFSANQNQMLRRATGRYLMPLNSDTTMTPGALRGLVQFMDAHPECGIAGPKLLRPDGTLQPSGRNYPDAINGFLEASGLWQLFRASRLIGRHYYLCHPHDEFLQVDWLSGACLITRDAVIRKVGPYDDTRFAGMYGEDLEWCWRVKRAGWEVCFDPSTVVFHLENQSPMDDRVFALYCGLYQFAATCYSAVAFRLLKAGVLGGLALRWLVADRYNRGRYRRLIALTLDRVETGPQ
jgi:GT2 family glycosyltransferase